MGIEALLTSQVIGLDAALSGKLNTSGGTVTGQLTNALGTITASTPLTISQTWNNAAVTFNPLLVSVTDTQSASGSLLMDLQVGGASKFKVGKGGRITTPEYIVSNVTSDILAGADGSGYFFGCGLGSGTTSSFVGTNANTNVFISGIGGKLYLRGKNLAFRVNDGQGGQLLQAESSTVLSLIDSTNAQTFRLYNTYTSSTSFENLQLQWSSNEARIGTSVGSAGGTQRSLVLGAWNSAGTWAAGLTVGTNGQLTNALGTITASTPATYTQTWNNVATTFTGILANVTDTASASGSLLMDLQVDGSSKVSVSKSGRITGPAISSTSPTFAFSSNTGLCYNSSNLYMTRAGTAEAAFTSGIITRDQIRFSTSLSATADCTIVRDAAGTLAQRDSTNAQVFNIYNTYTSSTSYERGKIAWESNVLKIGTEKGSAGGSARALELQTDGTTRLTVASTGGVTITDAINIAVGTTTGTKIGTGTTQKLGFWNATPVVQPTAVADATDAASVITQLNALLSRMRDLGLIAT